MILSAMSWCELPFYMPNKNNGFAWTLAWILAEAQHKELSLCCASASMVDTI